eukprot:scaffold408880_cov38-Prasinocladus_malaysianus.AAC.1
MRLSEQKKLELLTRVFLKRSEPMTNPMPAGVNVGAFVGYEVTARNTTQQRLKVHAQEAPSPGCGAKLPLDSTYILLPVEPGARRDYKGGQAGSAPLRSVNQRALLRVISRRLTKSLTELNKILIGTSIRQEEKEATRCRVRAAMRYQMSRCVDTRMEVSTGDTVEHMFD